MEATMPAKEERPEERLSNEQPEIDESPRRGFANTKVVWGTASFMLVFHLIAVVGAVWMVTNFNGWTLGLGIVWYFFCGLSITGGYHRLFAHRSYKASWPVRAFFLAFGAAAMQRSALIWSTDHRIHHQQTDKPRDPYSVKHGFWWAHIGWVFSDAALRNEGRKPATDLEADPLVRFQDRYWLPIALFFSFALPTAIGFLWGDPIGALLIAGFLRLCLTWHATFAVNSFAHRFGVQTYSKDESARDNAIVAVATLGEGYHNFHHRFQTDYRNGIRWFHYDPTKWLIWSLSKVKLTHGLVKLPQKVIDDARAAASAS